MGEQVTKNHSLDWSFRQNLTAIEISLIEEETQLTITELEKLILELTPHLQNKDAQLNA